MLFWAVLPHARARRSHAGGRTGATVIGVGLLRRGAIGVREGPPRRGSTLGAPSERPARARAGDGAAAREGHTEEGQSTGVGHIGEGATTEAGQSARPRLPWRPRRGGRSCVGLGRRKEEERRCNHEREGEKVGGVE